MLSHGCVSQAQCSFNPKSHRKAQHLTVGYYPQHLFLIEQTHPPLENVSPFFLLMNQAPHIFQ